jgi:subtilisin family serine protease
VKRLALLAQWPALLALWLSGCAAQPPTQVEPANVVVEPATDSTALDSAALDPGTLDPERLVIVTVRNVPGPAVPRAGSTQRDYDARSSYSVSPAARATARAIAVQHKLREVSSWPILALGVHCLVFELPAGAARGTTLESLRADGRVESAQPMQTFDTLSTPSTTYNDPYQQLQGNLQTLGIPQAHEWSRGEGVSIAVIDTAVDATHPDLAGRIKRQQNFLDPAASAAGSPIDRVRHGTAVAGVIAAVANNEQGIVGIAPSANLFAFNACWPGPELGRSVCNTFTLAKALAAAIEIRAHIINLSLAGPSDMLLTRLVNQALQRGIIVVGASTDRSKSFPAAIDGVIGVSSAVTGPAKVSSAGDKWALLAPGTDVLTLVPAGRYDFQSGSSLATASVSGGIALLLARDQKLRASQVHRLLASSSQSLMTATGETYSINICSALASLLRLPDCRTSSHPSTIQTSAIP